MKQTNKILAVVLSLVLVIGSLAACQTTEIPSLQSETYEATVEITFSSDNAALGEAIAKMQNTTKICVDGDDLKVETNATVGTTSVQNIYTYFGGTLYHKQSISADGKSATVLERTSLDEENRAQLLSDVGAGASIEATDFNIQNMEGDELNHTNSCSRITAKAKESLQAIYASKLQGFGTVELQGAEYVIVVENGREEKSTLTCHFAITMNGQSYEITMQVVTDYDYDAAFAITVPADSASYKQVLYSEMFD